MVKTVVSPEPKVGETESISKEFVKNFSQALEMETNKLRERAEQDSRQIIVSAREEADKIIAQAKQEAKVESDKLIAKLKEEIEQILRESREKAFTEARQESARIISKTREKTAQIITEIIERGITHAKSEFVRAASDARSRLESEKFKLFTVSKSIEQIIGETETNIQAEIEHLATVITETEGKLQLVNEIPHRETVMNSRQVAEVVRKTENAEKLEKQETEQTAGEEARVKTEEVKKTEGSDDNDIRMQEGIVLLESGKNEEALEAFVKVIELDPKNVIAWRKYGAILDRLGRHEESLKAFERAIELAPNYLTECLNNRKTITKLAGGNEAEEAKAAKKQLKNLKPETASRSKFTMLSRRVIHSKLF